MFLPITLMISAIALLVTAGIYPAWSQLVYLSVVLGLFSIVTLIVGRSRIKAPAQVHCHVIVDGSNVMHWKDGGPRINTVREVIAQLSDQGFTPGVMFDANAGYLLANRFQNDGQLARQLGLPSDRVMVVPKGTPADPYILTAARDMGARVVTNDQFRDWANEYPEVKTPGFLIGGKFRNGKLSIDLGSDQHSDL